MSLGEFLRDENTGGSWADDLTDLPSAPSGVGVRETKSSLDLAPDRDSMSYEGGSVGVGGKSYPPRAPAAPVPDEPPFQAYVGNLSYSVQEDDLASFFQGQKVKNIKLIKDYAENRSKGYGYIEFEDRESLVEALALSRTDLLGRPINIDVAEGGRSSGSKPFGSGGRDRPTTERRPFREEKPELDWSRVRSGEPRKIEPRKPASHGSFGGGNSLHASNSTSSFGSRRSDDSNPFSSSSARKPEDSPRTTRRPLQLKPRTKTETENGSTSVAASNGSIETKKDPFGGAKPRELNLATKKENEE